MKTKFLALLLLASITVSACVPTAPSPEPATTVVEEPLPVATEPAPQPELPIPTVWRAVRDPRLGFGLAIPCWWLTNPISVDSGLQTIKNYDEAYFNTHSTKGFWEWPNGTLKLDLVVFEGIDPAKSDADAYMQLIDPTMTGFVSAEQQQIGSHMVTIVTTSNLVNTNDPNVKQFIYRLTPDKLLMVVPIPQSIIETPDFQALLASVVLTQDEQISLPTITPAPALIDAPCAS